MIVYLVLLVIIVLLLKYQELYINVMLVDMEV